LSAPFRVALDANALIELLGALKRLNQRRGPRLPSDDDVANARRRKDKVREEIYRKGGAFLLAMLVRAGIAKVYVLPSVASKVKLENYPPGVVRVNLNKDICFERIEEPLGAKDPEDVDVWKEWIYYNAKAYTDGDELVPILITSDHKDFLNMAQESFAAFRKTVECLGGKNVPAHLHTGFMVVVDFAYLKEYVERVILPNVAPFVEDWMFLIENLIKRIDELLAMLS